MRLLASSCRFDLWLMKLRYVCYIYVYNDCLTTYESGCQLLHSLLKCKIAFPVQSLSSFWDFDSPCPS